MNIFDAVVNTEDSLRITAVAGSGKTTTIVDALRLIPKDKTKLFVAFNNYIVDELKKRIKQKDVLISTVHSLGWRAILMHYRKAKFDKNKLLTHIERYCNDNGCDQKTKFYYFYVISKIVNLMKLNLCNKEEQIVEICNQHDIIIFNNEVEVALEVFQMSVKDTKRFDFTDMIYFATFEEVKLKKYDFVFVDESQDLSPAAHLIIKKVLDKRSRLIAVGDPNQAIYGFAGADYRSYDNLSKIKAMTDLPLSVCYRCATDIVKEAKKIVSHIEPNKGATKGTVTKEGSLGDLKYGDWVLCRNVAPLVTLCIRLIKNDIKAKIKGKDIGRAITMLVKKMECSTLNSLFIKLDSELTKLRMKLSRNGIVKPEENGRYVYLLQQIELIAALSEGLSSIFSLVNRIENIFEDHTDGILLSTIHKAKGMENDRIFILCPELIPSRYANTAEQIEQEHNLLYVAITRAKKELTFIPDAIFKEEIKHPIAIQKKITSTRISKKRKAEIA